MHLTRIRKQRIYFKKSSSMLEKSSEPIIAVPHVIIYTNAEHLYNITITLFEKISYKSYIYYLIDINSYKKLLYNSLYEDFFAELKQYYTLVNQLYINREISFHSFITIIKHICRVLQWEIIEYSRKVYHIYIPKVI